MMFVPHWEDFFYSFLPAKGNALRGLFFENETERVGEVTNCIALGTARKNRSRRSGFLYLKITLRR